MPQPDPNDRMIRLGDALEEFYAQKLADVALESQRLGTVSVCNCGKSGAHESTIECRGGVR